MQNICKNQMHQVMQWHQVKGDGERIVETQVRWREKGSNVCQMRIGHCQLHDIEERCDSEK